MVKRECSASENSGETLRSSELQKLESFCKATCPSLVVWSCLAVEAPAISTVASRYRLLVCAPAPTSCLSL